MRWFFSLLLISNLSLLGWIYWQSQVVVPASVSRVETPAQRQLRLLSELTQAERLPREVENDKRTPAVEVTAAPVEPQQPEKAADDGNPTPAAPYRCAKINTTEKSVDFSVIASKAADIGIKLLDSGEEEVERVSYWVYVPPYKNANAVREAAARLARAKVRDFLVVRSGEYKHGISLGLFSQQERAERRLKEILALKLSIRRPEIQPRSTMISSYWMLLQVEQEKELQKLQPVVEAEGFQFKVVDCPG